MATTINDEGTMLSPKAQVESLMSKAAEQGIVGVVRQVQITSDGVNDKTAYTVGTGKTFLVTRIGAILNAAGSLQSNLYDTSDDTINGPIAGYFVAAGQTTHGGVAYVEPDIPFIFREGISIDGSTWGANTIRLFFIGIEV